MSDTTAVDLASLRCSWPTCRIVGDIHPMVSLDGGVTWWCLIHGDDSEVLPPLSTGPCAACAHCGHGCATWADATPLHPDCRRPWTMAKVAVEMKGAYARRRGT